MRNENYKGVVQADNTVYTNIFPAIVSEEVFDEVNARLKVSKRTSAHHKTEINYLLSGKLICGKCGGLMTGDSGKGKLGRIYNYYKCFTKKKNKQVCDKKSIGQAYIEEIVLIATQEFMRQTDLTKLAKKITEIYNKNISENHELKALEKELSEVNKKLKNLLSAIENGIFNNTTNERMRELEINKKELEEKIIFASSKSIKPFDKKTVLSFLESFKDLDYSLDMAKQRLIDLFVNRVVLFDNHVEIYFNTSDDKNAQLPLKKQPDSLEGSDCYLLAETKGFEPLCQFPDKRISSASRCDLFGTSPFLLILNSTIFTFFVIGL